MRTLGLITLAQVAFVIPVMATSPRPPHALESVDKSSSVLRAATGKSFFRHQHRLSPFTSSGNPPGSLPTFTRAFEYQGKTYTDCIVGSDPAGPAKTTTITVMIVPLRLDLGNGHIVDADHDLVDGQTVLADVLGSPIFNNASFSCGPTFIGNLQYPDAFQRADFWSELKDKPDHHFILRPVVLPSQTLVVPANEIYYQDQYGTDFVDGDWFDAQIQTLIPQLGAKPNQLVLFLAGNQVDTGSYHNAMGGTDQAGQPVKLPAQTYIVVDSLKNIIDQPPLHASTILSHEIIEWQNDPYGNNAVPAWEYSGPWESSDILETCDYFDFLPNSDFAVSVNGQFYYIEEAGFFDFFTRAPTSRSVNGWYTFHDLVDTFSISAAADDYRFAETDIDFPGAVGTFPLGNNNLGDVVGYYQITETDSAHGFVKLAGQFYGIDVPGAYGTIVSDINDLGQAVGYFYDANGVHGFTWRQGDLKVFDYSATADTYLSGINRFGQISATIYPHDGSPGFGSILKGGDYQLLPTLPFGTDVFASGINDFGAVVGEYDNQDPNRSFGFLEVGPFFFPLDFPAAARTYPSQINDRGDIVGVLNDVYGFPSGFYKHGGSWLHVFYGGYLTYLEGVNDRGDAVGYYTDPIAHVIHGMILTPIPGKF